MTNYLLAVNGTLMRGLELNHRLLAAGAQFVREDTTAGDYRLWAIYDRYPAMQRDPGKGSSLCLEIWGIQAQGLIEVLSGEPLGLTLGKVTLADGSEVLGFLAESWICESQPEITHHGGWRYYLAQQ